LLITLASWIGLLALSETASSILSRLLRINLKSSDFFLIRQFLGLSITAFLLFIVSIFSAINIYYLLVLGLGCGIYQIIKRFKLLRTNSYSEIYLSNLLPISLLIIHLLYASQTIYLGDTGGYHFGLIKWLSEYGIVNGLAHLEPRFGFNSSWLALSALFNQGFLDGRSGGIINGYLFFCCSYQIYLFYKNKTASIESYFLIIALLLVLPYSLRSGVILSPSPDFPIHIIGPIAGFIVLKQGALAYKTLFLLAGLSFNIKLSAVPLIIWIAYTYRSSFFKNWHKTILWGTFLVSPILLANFYSSGYPAYPSTVISFGSEWSLSTEIPNQIKSAIYDYAALTPEHWLKDRNLTNSFEKIYQWSTSKYEFITFLLIIFNAISFIYFLSSRQEKSSTQLINIKALAVLSITGFIFFILTAPTIRFGIQWLVIAPSAFLAYLVFNKKLSGIHGISLATVAILPIIFMTFPMANTQKLIYLAIDQHKIDHDGRSRFNPVYPPKLPNVVTLDDKYGNAQEIQSLQYKTGQYGINIALGPQCWNTPIPCATQINFELLQPELGYSGGFKSIKVNLP
jgi:hypothetical protein